MLVPAHKRITAQEVLDDPWIKYFAVTEAKPELPNLITTSLRTFKTAQKVKKAVLTYMATQLSEREMENLKKNFLDLDKNEDGRLSAEEIERGLEGMSSYAELIDLKRSIDTDKSGFVDYNEFLAAAIGEEIYLNMNKLLQAFNMFDKVI